MNRARPEDLRWAMSKAGPVTALYCVWALVVYAMRGQSAFDKIGMTVLRVLLIYFAVGAVAGVCIGLMRPLTHSRLGAYLVAAATGVPVGLALTVGIYGLPTRWSVTEWFVFVFYICFSCALLGSPLANAAGGQGASRTTRLPW